MSVMGNTISPINQSESAYLFLSIDWWESMIGIVIIDIFLIYCGGLIGKNKKNFKKWRLNLIKNGVKCNGYVKEIRVVGECSYEFKISYYSELQKKNIYFYTEMIYMPIVVDSSKKILCNVYESFEQQQNEDYDSELIGMSENRIYFNLNPIKLFKVVSKKYSRTWFGNTIAVDFRYEI